MMPSCRCKDVVLTWRTESQKSSGQKISDTVSGTGSNPEKEGKGILEQAGDALGLNNNQSEWKNGFWMKGNRLTSGADK